MGACPILNGFVVRMTWRASTMNAPNLGPSNVQLKTVETAAVQDASALQLQSCVVARRSEQVLADWSRLGTLTRSG